MDEYDTVGRPIRLRFRFSEEEADALGELARARGISSSALIREWLTQAINAHYVAPNKGTNDARRADRK